MTLQRAGEVPTPLFCEKRLQMVENKALEFEKESQEILRGGKPMKEKK
jgi:hypothetical protein